MSVVDFLLLRILARNFPDHVVRFALGLARAAWRSAFFGGALLVALAVARGGSPRLVDLIHGIRFTLSLAAVSIVNVVVTSVVPFVHDSHNFGPGMLLVFVIVMVLSLVLCARCSLSGPIVVDRELGAWWAIPESWMTTRGHFWQLALAYCATAIVVLPALLVCRGAFAARFFGVLADSLITLVTAHIYIRVTSSPATLHNTAEPLMP